MKLIWIKVAKTGGTSIKTILANQVLKCPIKYFHCNLAALDDSNREISVIWSTKSMKYYYERHKKSMEDAVIVCSIRDPVDRFLSGCRHLKTNPNMMIDNLPSKETNHYNYIHCSMTLNELLLEDKIVPDYWIRQEYLIEDLQTLCNHLKKTDPRYDIELKNVMVNISKRPTVEVTPETLQKIKKHVKKDYKYYDKVEEVNQSFIKGKIV